MLPVSPWLIALWSSNKSQALRRVCLFPCMPLLALTFSLPMQDLTAGMERGTALRTFFFFFFLLPYLGPTCLPSAYASHQWEQMGSTLVSSLTWECTFVPPLVLANLGWCGSDCAGRSETELQYLYRSPYNHKKSRTDDFALTCSVKYLINNLNILQIPSLTDSIWIAFCKLSGLKFKHIRAL